MANMADNPDEKYSIINLILFFSFIFFSILTYLIVILVYYFRIQRLAISEKEMIHNFQEFLDN
jgi:CHASE3 domain sensor protein